MKKTAKLHAALVALSSSEFESSYAAEEVVASAVAPFGGTVKSTDAWWSTDFPKHLDVSMDGAILAHVTIHRTWFDYAMRRYCYLHIETISRSFAECERLAEKGLRRLAQARYMAERAAVMTALEMGGEVEYITGQEYGTFRLPEGNPVSARRTLMAMGYSDAKARQMLEAVWNDGSFSLNANDRINGRPGSLDWEMTA
jgi:hypothetical protein